LAEAATELTTGQAEPEAVLERRLRAFRRRNLWRSGLGLCFAAALCNEVYRWRSIIVGSGWASPFLTSMSAPFFLATAFLLVRRRWTPEYTASRAGRGRPLFRPFRQLSRILPAPAPGGGLSGGPGEGKPSGPLPRRRRGAAPRALPAARRADPARRERDLPDAGHHAAHRDFSAGAGREGGFRTDAGSPGEGMPPSHVAKSVKSDQQTAQPNPDPRHPTAKVLGKRPANRPRPPSLGHHPRPRRQAVESPATADFVRGRRWVPKTRAGDRQEPKIVDPSFSPTEEAGAQPKPKIQGFDRLSVACR